MRINSTFLAFSGLELARYFLVSSGVSSLAGADAIPQMLRFVASPGLVPVAAFFFLGLDPLRYGVFRNLVLVGKVVALFSAALALPGLLSSLGGVGAARLADLASLGLVVLWDLASGLVVLLWRRPEPAGGPGGSDAGEPYIESVEAK